MGNSFLTKVSFIAYKEEFVIISALGDIGVVSSKEEEIISLKIQNSNDIINNDTFTVSSVQFSPSKKLIGIGFQDKLKHIEFYSTDSWKKVYSTTNFGDGVNDFGFNQLGTLYAVAASNKNEVQIFTVLDQCLVCLLRTQVHPKYSNTIGISPSLVRWHPRMNLMAIGCNTGMIELWQIEENEDSKKITTLDGIKSIETVNYVKVLEWSPFGSLASVDNDNPHLIKVWYKSLNQNDVIPILSKNVVSKIIWSNHHSILIAINVMIVNFWDVSSKTLLYSRNELGVRDIMFDDFDEDQLNCILVTEQLEFIKITIPLHT